MNWQKLCEHRAKLGIALAFMALGGTEASACGWWACDDGAYGYRMQGRVYGYAYAPPPRKRVGYRIRTRNDLNSAPPIPGGGVGLQAPITSSAGLMQSAMPASGPTLFGSTATMPSSYGYSGSVVRGWQRRHRNPVPRSR